MQCVCVCAYTRMDICAGGVTYTHTLLAANQYRHVRANGVVVTRDASHEVTDVGFKTERLFHQRDCATMKLFRELCARHEGVFKNPSYVSVSFVPFETDCECRPTNDTRNNPRELCSIMTFYHSCQIRKVRHRFTAQR